MNHPITIWNDWAGAWSEAFWRASLQGGLAILLVWLICLAVPRLPARIKCWLWRIAYLKVLVALVWSAPLELPLLQAPKIVQSETLGFVPPMPIPAAVLPLENERVEIIADAPISLPDEPTETLPIVERVPVIVEMPSQADTPVFSLTAWCLLIWSIALALGLVRLTRSYWSTRRLLRESRPADDERLLALWNEWKQRMGASGKTPRLRLVAGSGSPLLVGVWRPVVLLPEQLLSRFDEQQIGMMLGHELAHARRRDLLWNWLPAIVTNGLFFHPLVWLARRGLYAAQEAACDEMVITLAGVSPRDYGHVLITLVEQLSGHPYHRPLGALGVVGQKHSLARRLKTMQSIQQFSRRKLVLIAATITTLAIIGTVPWTLVAQPPQRKLSKAERKAAVQTVEEAKKAYEVTLALSEFGQAPPNSNAIWSRHWLEAEKIVANTRAEEIAAHFRHLQRMEARVQVVAAHNQHGTDKGSALDFSAAKFYRNQARYLLLRAGGTVDDKTRAVPEKAIERNGTANKTEEKEQGNKPHDAVSNAKSDLKATQALVEFGQVMEERLVESARNRVAAREESDRRDARRNDLQKAETAYAKIMSDWANGQTNHNAIVKTSDHWLSAELAAALTFDKRIKAYEKYEDRAQNLLTQIQKLRKVGHAAGSKKILAEMVRYKDEASRRMVRLGDTAPLVTLASKDDGTNASEDKPSTLDQALRADAEQKYLATMKNWKSDHVPIHEVYSAIYKLISAERGIYPTEANQFAMARRESALRGDFWLATKAKHTSEFDRERLAAKEWYQEAKSELKRLGATVAVTEDNK